MEDDIESGGMPGTGTVTGTMTDTSIEFVKQMPQMGVFKRNGEVRMFNRKHHPIHYSGTSTDGIQYSGTWSMKPIFKFLWLIPIGKSEGNWLMERTQD